MITYDQAAIVIPQKDTFDFFQRHGYRISKPNPTSQEIAKYFYEVANAKGKPAQDDLMALAKASAKKLGGCDCKGNCGGCSGKKMNAEGDNTQPLVDIANAGKNKNFVQQHSALLIGGGILIALALILRK
jgi:hypothetical protein